MAASLPPVDYSRQTVMVTGASAGIGAEFARQLAQRGSDLVLVARRADRLDALARELRAGHDITVSTLPLDLTQRDVGELVRHELDTRQIEVTSIVNNAGFANHGPFHELDLPRLTSEIALNASSVVEICHTFLPRLRQRGDGFLINVASMAAYQANPTMAVYGASKAFVLSFTEALWYEARGTGLRVLALSPGATQTEFFDVAGASADGGSQRMSAGTVVAAALAGLDRRNPPPNVVAGRSNKIAPVVGRLVGRRRMTELVGARMTRTSGVGCAVAQPHRP
ncbi:SDR family NAD(P)-dependent oxidoreductase [Micromonospora sp. CA-263727]|uniref:SDR family NAD(P)-dependent oxidoreductase n=1 Tax=Micromonospora sp. CA-263727 TaxID=3239967 RepID=UPI003D90E437